MLIESNNNLVDILMIGDVLFCLDVLSLVFGQKWIARRWIPDGAWISSQIFFINARKYFPQIHFVRRNRKEFVRDFGANFWLSNDSGMAIVWHAPCRRHWSFAWCFSFVIGWIAAFQHIEIVCILFTWFFCFHFILPELLLHGFFLSQHTQIMLLLFAIGCCFLGHHCFSAIRMKNSV